MSLLPYGEQPGHSTSHTCTNAEGGAHKASICTLYADTYSSHICIVNRIGTFLSLDTILKIISLLGVHHLVRVRVRVKKMVKNVSQSPR